MNWGVADVQTRPRAFSHPLLKIFELKPGSLVNGALIIDNIFLNVRVL